MPYSIITSVCIDYFCFVVHPDIILSLILCDDPGIGGGLGILLLHRNLRSNVSDLAQPGDLGLKPPSRTQTGALHQADCLIQGLSIHACKKASAGSIFISSFSSHKMS